MKSDNNFFIFALELFWTAPEHLCEDAIPRCSQAGDTYSYGIILSELLSREEPYSSHCVDPKGDWKNLQQDFTLAAQSKHLKNNFLREVDPVAKNRIWEEDVYQCSSMETQRSLIDFLSLFKIFYWKNTSEEVVETERKQRIQ